MDKQREATGAQDKGSTLRRFVAAVSQSSWLTWLAVIGLVLLIALPRLTALNQYIIVDEADRWRWAENFVYALTQGDLAGTLVGDGYPGIVPVWAESLWVLLEAGRRSLVEGQWIGQVGLGHLFHEWDRTAYLAQQRFPIVLLNTILALVIVWAVWRLFGKRVALIGGLLIALDPFYLSDSRVNRAEAVIAGLMTLSVLALIFYYRQRQFRYVILSGILGGLSFLTKIQALAILPVVALAGLLVCLNSEAENKSPYFLLPTPYFLKDLIKFGLGWTLAAGLTWLILWPSMWVTPLETLSMVYNYTTRKVGTEGVNLFFLGRTYQDADPGLLFYPVVFLMRITPLALLGLIGVVARYTLGRKKPHLAGDPFAAKGSLILVIYVLAYAFVMTVGSHKQDRYLMPVFLSVDILAAMGLVYLWVWLDIWRRQYGVGSREYERETAGKKGSFHAQPATPYSLLLALSPYFLFLVLVIIQLATVLPHHPYYYTYFNPLFGGGQTAVRTLRIGWGEGMDQVGEYLAEKPDSEELVVSTRFTHNILDFKGELISLVPGGRWTRADYIVLYIQQVQRGMDPSRGFLEYFQARQPEKVIRLGGIDYAWIYPIPFDTPADPKVSLIPGQAAMLGYSWETVEEQSAPSQIRLLWENLGLAGDREVVARLDGAQAETAWTACQVDPAFTRQAQTPGAYVESLCPLATEALPPGIYTVEFGLTANKGSQIEAFLFPQGWQAARVTAEGQVVDTGEIEQFDAIAGEVVPPEAHWLDRVYDGRLRLVAYRLDPAEPKPGTKLELVLYWQVVKEVLGPVHLITQLAESRDLSLGRSDSVHHPETWLPGEIKLTRHQFEVPSDFEGPLAGRIEVSLRDEANVSLQPTTLAGQTLDPVVGHFTVAPETWPIQTEAMPVEAVWPHDLSGPSSDGQKSESPAKSTGHITLRGYTISPEQARPGEPLAVTLFWQTNRKIAENYKVFVHLLDKTGQIRAQNDSLPRAGAYPTLRWQPDVLIEDTHFLSLPADLPTGTYQLIVGLYRSQDGTRLLLTDGNDAFDLASLEIQ